MTTYQKVKSVAKRVVPRGEPLTKTILATMAQIGQIVGNTLGPGGMPVLIEREEVGLPAFVTKDGVTVYRALGFDDPVAHAVLEAARDASIRTANEAGDGTTTATVLSEAIVRNTMAFVTKHPKVAPQRVVRLLQSEFKKTVEPLIRTLACPVDSSADSGQTLMWKTALTSANGDNELADAVVEAFDITGDAGNVTLSEASGPSHYEVEHISGYPIPMGYEDSLGSFSSKFINDQDQQRIVLDDPVFVLYHGKLTELNTVIDTLTLIAEKYTTMKYNHNVVVVATGFSEAVLGTLAYNFGEAATIKVVPLLVPMSPQIGGEQGFLGDLSALTGAKVFDPINQPLSSAQIGDFGPMTYTPPDADEPGVGTVRCHGVKHVEVFRFRANILGTMETAESEALLEARISSLEVQKTQSGVSSFDRTLLQERIARLSGGIARLKVFGASNGELKEKRDRADDAVCAVRGALAHGVLPGGAWTFAYVVAALEKVDDPLDVIKEILIPSLMTPFARILQNAGYNTDEIDGHRQKILANARLLLSKEDESLESALIVDVITGDMVSAMDRGIVDSTPAVLEALRNSLSIASLLGTLGGTVVFPRDMDLERSEARATAAFNRGIEMGELNEANERV